MSENDVFVQHGTRSVKLWHMSVGAFMRINTGVILTRDVIKGNRSMVQAKTKGCQVLKWFLGN